MSKSKGSVASTSMGVDSPGVTHERILRVLGITQRPLQSGELANALGMFNSEEASGACQWLTEKGYITGTGAARPGKATQRAMTSWSLADKGRLWVKDQVTRPAQRPQGH